MGDFMDTVERQGQEEQQPRQGVTININSPNNRIVVQDHVHEYIEVNIGLGLKQKRGNDVQEEGEPRFIEAQCADLQELLGATLKALRETAAYSTQPVPEPR
jgi:hypothetical protein